MPGASGPRDRLRGTLDLLVLKTLTGGPRHGYSIARWLAQESDDAVRVEEGSLYPALYRLEERGLVSSEWRTSDGGRAAKLYALTPLGRKHLRAETDEWLAFAKAVTRILQPQT
jgi:transcriptional regulator